MPLPSLTFILLAAILVALVKKTAANPPMVQDRSETLYRPSRLMGTFGGVLIVSSLVFFGYILLLNMAMNDAIAAGLLLASCGTGMLMYYVRNTIYYKTTDDSIIKRNFFQKVISIQYKDIVSLSYNRHSQVLLVQTDSGRMNCYYNVIGFNFLVQTLEEKTGLVAEGWLVR